MGLASALSTALTGLTAAETTIDVVGNNLANASTVGFKASKAEFATQFAQTRSLGSGPTTGSGGTNPRQIGLGVQVAEITADFSQGTVQGSASPSDLAIQGDGFFIVKGSTGEELYTRNGVFKTNSQNELVTITGERLVGFGIDSNYNVVTTALTPLTIPLGTAAVAQATRNATMEGTLTPTGDLADTSGIIESGVLGAGEFDAPSTAPSDSTALPPLLNTMGGSPSGVGPLGPGTYSYKVVFVDSNGRESPASTLSVLLGAGPSGMELNNIPVDASGDYVGRRIYRSVQLESLPAGTDPSYYLVKDIPDNTTTSLAASALGVDTVSDATLTTQTALDTNSLTGNYSYYVTYYIAGQPESRPSPMVGPRNVTDGRITLSDFPTPTGEYAGAEVRIYRNLATDSSSFYRVADVSPGETFTDNVPDSTIVAGGQKLDMDGPKIEPNTLLVNVVQRDGNVYSNLFVPGELAFTGRKGGRLLSEQTLTVTNTTTVQDLVDFMNQSLGIQPANADPGSPIVGDKSGTPLGGAVLSSGKLQFVSNTGVDNAVGVSLSAFSLTPDSGSPTITPNLTFSTTQQAKGQSAVSEFIAYDSLGIPVNVRVTVAMESRTGNSTIYRWYADSPDNQPVSGSDISVGTGTITFDGEGNVVSVSNSTVSIERRDVSSVSPMEFSLDFSQLSGLAATKSTLAASRQDGSSAGTLSSYIIGEDGLIRGVFSNGVTRNLGQIRLARFTNPAGLEQRGENMFAAGVNSGLPVQGDPGTQGIGGITAGAIELSNTDIGKNLIELILASTSYRGNTRVVTTAQQLLDELLALRR